MRSNTFITNSALPALLTIAMLAAFTGCSSIAPRKESVSQATAREELLAGNARFVAGGMHAHTWHEERVVQTGAFGQHPSVGILSCADSRVPPEIIFDEGIGDLFVVRDAGNFESVGGTATFEYGVAALGVHTIVVLGHTKCGAINATVAGTQLPGNMPVITAAISPGLVGFMKTTAASGAKPDLTAASEANVRWQMQQLMERSAMLAAARKSGSLTLLGAMYDVDTGVVRFLD